MDSRRLIELGRILIPDLDHIEAHSVSSIGARHDLGANAHTGNLIFWIRGHDTGHSAYDIGLIILWPMFSATTNAIAAAPDILVILPKWGDRIPHTEEHAALNLVAEFLKDGKGIL